MKWYKKARSYFRDHIFDMFPFYYHNTDTYKDPDGKGILQRFLEVCGSYLDNEVMPDVDNFMDCLDVDISDPIFLNYIWEYFGFIPYSYGIIIQGKPLNPEDIKREIIEYKHFPYADTRLVLKYAISLYKIRGTKKFYDILGRIYGVKFELTPKVPEDPDWDYKSIKGSIYEGFHYDSYNRFDSGSKCMECLEYNLTITIPKGYMDFINSLDEKSRALVIQTYVNIINKYLPINIKPIEVSESDLTIKDSTNIIYIL